jgi:glycosyltransferase involved in cell wall biosynthesis
VLPESSRKTQSAMPLKILYIKPSFSPFIEADQKILEKNFVVTPFLFKQASGKWRYSMGLITLVFFLWRHGRKADIFACWFGNYHTAVMVAVAHILKKPTVVFAGGQESICYRELGKGVYVNKVRGFLVRYALRNCTLIIPNHASLIYHENFFYNSDNPHIDGIRHYCGEIKGSYEVIPNGIDTSRINRLDTIPKEPGLVATVGTMHKTADFYNKGFDLFIEVARRCSDLKFVMIGLKKQLFEWTETTFKVSEIPNLQIIPSFCPTEVLNEYLNKATVYVQVSITEGMPVSLGEAMLCECVPVGSAINGIPDAIGENGIIIHKRDATELEQAIRKAMLMDTGKRAREHTLRNFSFAEREERIKEVFNRFFKVQVRVQE